MVRRRELLRALGLSTAAGIAGWNTLGGGSDQKSPRERTQTTVLTPAPTATATDTVPPAESPTATPYETGTPEPTTTTATATPRQTVAEQVGTPVYAYDRVDGA